MSELKKQLGSGPLDDLPFPEQLTLHISSPGGNELRGYDLERDLAQHYSATETMMLALGGELADAVHGIAADVAMTFAAVKPAAGAATQAIIAARLCGTELPALMGIAATALAAEARSELQTRVPVLRWLTEGAVGPPPPECCEGGKDGAAGLYLALGARGAAELAPDRRLDRLSALMALFFRLGLQDLEQQVVAFTMARMPATMAEALVVRGRAFGGYPANLPGFVYQEGCTESGHPEAGDD